MTKYNKIILGGGITALLARKLLGDDWTIIPFNRSRFYSFSPALADNFIIRDEKIDDVITYLGGKPRYAYKIRYSLGGELFDYQNSICEDWLNKTFHGNYPPHALPYLKSRSNFFVYDLRVNKLYESLQNEYKKEIGEQAKAGKITQIGDHFFVRNNEKHEFEHCVSTIPLPALTGLLGINGMMLESSPYWVFHIETEHLDFEGSNQLLVVDDMMDFYKVVNIRPGRYVFYCNREISQPGPYFMQFMRRYDILDGTVIPDALIKGPRPDLSFAEKFGIRCIGSYAEWDWCADIGSCIMAILRFKGDLVQL